MNNGNMLPKEIKIVDGVVVKLHYGEDATGLVETRIQARAACVLDIPPHVHPYAEMIFVQEGIISVYMASQEVPVEQRHQDRFSYDQTHEIHHSVAAGPRIFNIPAWTPHRIQSCPGKSAIVWDDVVFERDQDPKEASIKFATHQLERVRLFLNMTHVHLKNPGWGLKAIWNRIQNTSHSVLDSEGTYPAFPETWPGWFGQQVYRLGTAWPYQVKHERDAFHEGNRVHLKKATFDPNQQMRKAAAGSKPGLHEHN